MRRFRLSSDIVVLHGMVEGNFHCFLQLDVRLCSGENFAHPSNIVLEEVLVHGVRNLQPVDERESRDIFIAVRDLDELSLEEIDVRLEHVTLSHLDGEVLLFFLASWREVY